MPMRPSPQSVYLDLSKSTIFMQTLCEIVIDILTSVVYEDISMILYRLSPFLQKEQ